MPETLETFDFDRARSAGGSPNAIYPWDEWIKDGVIHRYVMGQDFQTTPRHFASQLRRAAFKRGFLMDIHRDKDSVTGQPRRRTDVEWLAVLADRERLEQQRGQLVEEADQDQPETLEPQSQPVIDGEFYPWPRRLVMDEHDPHPVSD